MSDKDECVEMSEGITLSEDVNNQSEAASSKESKNESETHVTLDDGGGEQDMGQIKSKLKKLHSQKSENQPIDDEVKIDIAEPDGEFMCGVVEGFYGRPWTTEQRKELFRRMKEMGMNTYLYGPKDDYKHRLYWRDLYSDDEAELLKLLMESAAEYDVLFIYAISPGLDMSFASEKELDCLKSKLIQVKNLGCKAYAVLFDDIDPLLSAADKTQYSSAASAQASVTNQMYEALGKPRFLFCPTEYCTSMAIPDVANSKYLNTIGEELDEHISVMWTGPKVVSKYITVEPIRQLTRVLRRKVVIWDNIHANDYDPKRMFLGPFKGRSTHLIPHLGGVLTNPNCEFESNFIAMHTLSSWWKSYANLKEEDKKYLEGSCNKPSSPTDDDKEIPKSGDNSVNSEQISPKVVSPKHQEECEEKIEPANVEIVDQKGNEINLDDQKSPDEKQQSSDVPSKEDEPTHMVVSQAPNTSPVSSGVSSLVESEESDTDSDYSSHNDGYLMARCPISPPFDHGLYNPDHALTEAIKSWLPYFCAPRLPHGKMVARSGPPLSMLSHGELSLMSNAVMGPPILTTNVLKDDPILSTSILSPEEINKIQYHKSDKEIEFVENDKPRGESNLENNDVEMSGADHDCASQLPEVDLESTEKSEDLLDVKMHSSGDTDTSNDCKEKKDDELQVAESSEKEDPSGNQMETEEEEQMQCEGDLDSDVSMTTTQSSEEKKIFKEPDVEKKGESSSMSEESAEIVTASHHSSPLASSVDSSAHVTMDCPADDNLNISSPFISDPMTHDDIQLIVELFYLPYEHGTYGRLMIQDYLWLQSNIRQAVIPPNAPSNTKNESMDRAMKWMERAIHFEDRCSTIRKVCNKLLSCSNRALLYDLFPYFWDMKGVVSMLSTYIKWMGQFYLRHQPAIPLDPPEPSSKQNFPSSTFISISGPQVPPIPPAAVWLGSDPEPWIFRGGLSGEFQRLLPISMANDLFCQAIPCSLPYSSNTYTIRPYLPNDEKAVYNICLTTGNDGTDFADDFTGYEDLPGERLVGGLLTLSPEYCFVVEDELGICGYLVGTANAKLFWKKCDVSFWPEVKEKYKKKEGVEEKVGEDIKRILDEVRSNEALDFYAVDNLYVSHPAYMQIAIHRRVTDPTIARSMTVCMLSALKSHNVHGVHTTVKSSDCYMPDQYCRLGFREIQPFGVSPPSPQSCTSSPSKEDRIIVFGRNF